MQHCSDVADLTARSLEKFCRTRAVHFKLGCAQLARERCDAVSIRRSGPVSATMLKAEGRERFTKPRGYHPMTNGNHVSGKALLLT